MNVRHGITAVAAVLIVPAVLAGQQPVVAGQLRSGTLSFDGKASLGDFTGTTQTVTGAMTGGPDLASVRGWVEAPVKTLKTGNGRRDRDLVKTMDADSFPNLRFELSSVTTGAGSGDSTTVTLHGKLVIHGVTHDVALPGSVVIQTGAVRVRTDFPLNLHDYEITRLSRMLGILKMQPDIVVHVDVTFAQ